VAVGLCTTVGLGVGRFTETEAVATGEVGVAPTGGADGPPQAERRTTRKRERPIVRFNPG